MCLITFKIHVTCVGALSASSTTRTWPNLTAVTKGESSYTTIPSRTVGCSVSVCTVVSLIRKFENSFSFNYSLPKRQSKVVHTVYLCNWMYSRGRFSNCSSLSASLFFPTPWLPTNNRCSPKTKSWRRASRRDKCYNPKRGKEHYNNSTFPATERWF